MRGYGDLYQRNGDVQRSNRVPSPTQVQQTRRADTDFRGQVVSVFPTRPVDSRDFAASLGLYASIADGRDGYGGYDVVHASNDSFQVPEGYTAIVTGVVLEGVPGYFPGPNSDTRASVALTKNGAAIPDIARNFAQISYESWSTHLVFATMETISVQVIFPRPAALPPIAPLNCWFQATISGVLIQTRGASALDQASGPVFVKVQE